jgi:hypothetical protein
MQNRSVATVIILTIITCGIYGWYWVYVTAQALEAEGRSGQLSPLLLLVLCLLVPNVGYALLGWVEDTNINAVKSQRGIPAIDNRLAYILLGIFIPIVLIAILQNEINQLVPAVQ